MAKVKKRKIKFKRGSALTIFRLGAVALSLMFLFYSIGFLIERQTMISKKEELLAKIEEQTRLSVVYEEELSRVGTKEYYEYMARKNLGYIYPDEYIMLVTE